MKYYLVRSIRSIWHSFASPIFHIEAHMLLCRILHNHPSCLYMACLYVYHLKKIFKIYSISLSVIKKIVSFRSLKHLHFISKLCNRFIQSRSHFFILQLMYVDTLVHASKYLHFGQMSGLSVQVVLKHLFLSNINVY